MKGDKKILVVAILVLLLAVCFGTYAIYRATGSATGSIKAAAWSVKVDGTDIASTNYTLGADDITWTTLTGYNHTIAPGSEGYIEIPVDATGSEVAVVLTATLGSTTLPNGMTATLASGSDSQTIAYSTTENAMKTNVRINIAWAGAESDDSSKDSSDLTASGTTISIPVTLTAKQSLTNHAS
jgi:hypothetical protein